VIVFDSKSVLNGQIYSLLIARVKLVMIIPQHALIGFSLPTRSDENNLYLTPALNYLLMEPTGPALRRMTALGTLQRAPIAQSTLGLAVTEANPLKKINTDNLVFETGAKAPQLYHICCSANSAKTSVPNTI